MWSSSTRPRTDRQLARWIETDSTATTRTRAHVAPSQARGSKLPRPQRPVDHGRSRLHRRVDRNSTIRPRSARWRVAPSQARGSKPAARWRAASAPRVAPSQARGSKLASRCPPTNASESRLHRRVDRNSRVPPTLIATGVSRLHRRVDRNWINVMCAVAAACRAFTGAWIETRYWRRMAAK